MGAGSTDSNGVLPVFCCAKIRAVSGGKGVVASITLLRLLSVSRGCAGVSSECWFAQSVYNSNGTYKASHQCGHAGDFSDSFFAQSTYHSDRTYKASHLCG